MNYIDQQGKAVGETKRFYLKIFVCLFLAALGIWWVGPQNIPKWLAIPVIVAALGTLIVAFVKETTAYFKVAISLLGFSLIGVAGSILLTEDSLIFNITLTASTGSAFLVAYLFYLDSKERSDKRALWGVVEVPPQYLSLNIPGKATGTTAFALLSWEARLTKLFGRDKDIGDIQDWLGSVNAAEEQGNNLLSVGIISGPGGVGKTRLAAHLAEQARQTGWEAGFLDRKDDTDIDPDLKDEKHLIVIDYPEERLEFVECLLLALANKDLNQPVAVLFLSRKEEAFWADLFHKVELERQLTHFPIQSLPEQSVDGSAAWNMYQAASEELDTPAISQTQFSEWYASETFHQRPLFILALAVELSLQKDRVADTVALQGADVLLALAKREKARLQEQSTDYLTGSQLCQLKAVAILADNIDVSDTTSWTDFCQCAGLELPELTDEHLQALNHTELFGKTRPGAADALLFHVDKVQPDLLAAAFFYEIFLPAITQDKQRLMGNWAYAAMAIKPEEYIHNLARVVFDVGQLIDPKTANGIVEAIMLGDGSLSPEQLEARALRLLPAANQHQANNVAVLSVQILRNASAAHIADDEKAALLNNLSVHLSSQGRESGALLAVEESVELRRALAASNPSRYNADLASSLNNLSNRLSSQGRESEALLAVEESVDLRRVLAASNPSRYNANLASSLHSLSNRLSSQGQEAEALAVIEECIDIRRVLTEQNPQRHAPSLAGSLANCSLSVVDSDPQRAVALINEAVDLIRPTAEQYPDSQYGQWYQQMLELQKEYQANLNETNNNP